MKKQRHLKNDMHFPGTKVGIALRGPARHSGEYEAEKNKSRCNVIGGDENYLELNGYNIAYGRNFTETEVETGRNVCMIGKWRCKKLFPDNNAKAIDQIIKVDHIPYRVIAVLKDKGSSAFLIPVKLSLPPIIISGVYLQHQPEYIL